MGISQSRLVLKLVQVLVSLLYTKTGDIIRLTGLYMAVKATIKS